MTARLQKGFTLIEAIAAFVLLAMFLGVLLSALGISMRQTTRAEQESLAAEWAQSKLDLVGIGEKLDTGSTRGRFDDDYRWEMDVVEYDPPREEPLEMPLDPKALGMNLYRVDLTVSWGPRGRERTAKFTTLRAYSPDQAVLFENADPAAAAAGAAAGVNPGQRPPPGQAGTRNPRRPPGSSGSENKR